MVCVAGMEYVGSAKMLALTSSNVRWDVSKESKMTAGPRMGGSPDVPKGFLMFRLAAKAAAFSSASAFRLALNAFVLLSSP